MGSSGERFEDESECKEQSLKTAEADVQALNIASCNQGGLNMVSLQRQVEVTARKVGRGQQRPSKPVPLVTCV